MFDRFDIAAAYALYWSRYHTGQFTRGYARLSTAMRLLNGYCPTRLADLTDNGREIYRGLVQTHGGESAGYPGACLTD